MTEGFLTEIARVVLQKSSETPGKLLVVLPTQRSKTYLLSRLQALIDKPVWAPKFITISELVAELSGLSKADNILLLIRLHTLFLKHTGRSETLDNFIQWGRMILSDFDDIDKSLADARLLYRNLEQLKSMEGSFDFLSPEQYEVIERFWKNFDIGKYSPLKQNFVRIWTVLGNIYEQFSRDLLAEGLAYEGLMYRIACDKVKEGTLSLIQFSEQIMVVGLNALSAAEEKILTHLKLQGKTSFYWDYASDYINDEYHQAGFFMRRNLQQFPSPSSFSNVEKHTRPSIEAISCAGLPAQLAAANYILTKFSADELSETAIVLADTSLTPLLLQFIPDNVKELNITMGYPMKVSQTFSLLQTIKTIVQKAVWRNGQYYVANHLVNSLLTHPLLDNPLKEGTFDSLREITEKWSRGYAPFSILAGFPVLDEIHNIMKGADNPSVPLARLFEKVMEWQTDPGLETDTLNVLVSFFYKLKSMTDTLSTSLNKESVLRLAIDYLQTETLPFEGLPLKGLQVLGPLETRALDFRYIIVIGLNEGIWPSQGMKPSFVPYSLRDTFGLPAAVHNDAISTYVFYRLLHHSDSLWLIYNNASSDGKMFAEPSRFLLQLKHTSAFRVNERIYAPTLHPEKDRIIVKHKTTSVLSELASYQSSENDRYLSPSALNTYLDCSLRFYYKYIEKITEPEDRVSTIRPNEFGNALHMAIQNLYNTYLNHDLTPDILQQLANRPEDIAKSVEAAITKTVKTFSIPHEYITDNASILMATALSGYVGQIIRYDARVAPLTLTHLEAPFRTVIPINLAWPSGVILGGTIDRIHRAEGQVYIIDYKTGYADTEFKSVDDLFSDELTDRNAAVFQLLCYAVLYRMNTGDCPQTGIYRTTGLFGEGYDFRISPPGNSTMDETLDYFENRLTETLTELFDPEIPIRQTAKTERCAYCPYKILCARI